MKPTPKYKMAILIWIAIYPTINLLFWILGDNSCALDGVCAFAFDYQNVCKMAFKINFN
jgi:antibiotic biosynthesis monooxygenase (ABM) superfamily enzyme